MGKVYIAGTGEQAQIVAEILTLNHQDIGGFFDDNDSQEFLGYPVCGTINAMEKVIHSEDSLIVAIGNCLVRERIYERCRGKLNLASAIHPSTIMMPSAILGAGVVIHPGVIIETSACIGDGTILNTGCIIEHHNSIGPYSQICPGVTLGGKVTIGTTTWIGLGSAIRDHLEIGSYVFIGQGSNVLKSLPDGVLAYGNPARIYGRSPYAE
jgi:sugar O-acyltransferase (sialic acid O-acetyltransferase NeuD family)